MHCWSAKGNRWGIRAVGLLSLAVWTVGAVGAASPDLDLARKLNAAFVEVAESVSPAVVVVRVRPKPDSGRGLEGNWFRMLPEEMQKELEERLEKERARPQPKMPADYFPEQGSGVVFREDGYILTNGHVVKEAEKIEVRLKDGRRLPAEVKGVDTESDIAVLKVDASGLPVARLGDSSKVRVGEFAIAIGAPFELDYSVTFGHVSAKGRRVMMDAVMMDQDFLQTDASINPGNSGGPLVNIEGEVIGINSMIRGMNTGIGFAVPVNLAREVAQQLIDKGRFVRAWLGGGNEPVGENADSTPADVPVKDGVVVTRIFRDGPSWGSELETQDVIVGIEGQTVRDVADLKRLVSRKAVGKPIKVEVYRGEKKMEIQLTPGELPEDRMAMMRPGRRAPAEPETVERAGMTVRTLDAETAKRLDLEPGEGVLVVNVEEDSPAAQQQIQPGDVITKINRRPVRTPNEFRAVMSEGDLKKGISVTVVAERGRSFRVLKQAGE
ncbi:MAG: trypsin-like peptidase domain-containing protein [Verrucomicrobiales bacterium]|nr:trypsin-like peptidase domain-containing protein [Verrucomicrobiales bacterium]